MQRRNKVHLDTAQNQPMLYRRHYVHYMNWGNLGQLLGLLKCHYDQILDRHFFFLLTTF